IIPPLLWPQQVQTPQVSQGVVCPQCRFVNPSEAKFCMNCGFMLGVRCPQCGFVNPPGAKFCANCGAKL
ncbi:MAG: zinc-ribbon domain-containing protein, partial [Pyrobaculum sp.]